ncbi:MAG: TPM domain-containing protein [Roseburia sp.]|nr:TPM domain-containing protein [Roseburia sp.]MCM1098652.1 TPM domain-containing protein [Ruminococcus flavefaciens]
MDQTLMKEERKQYFHYFRFWFIIVGILLMITLGLGIFRSLTGSRIRQNQQAPAERVFDGADVLTEEEEEKLRRYIAEKEAEYGIDFVIMTFSRPVEGTEAQEQYHYRFTSWERNMTDIADDFWDENQFGFNKGFEGDGSILIDNRYPGQRGEWLSTSGRVEARLGNYEVNEVLDAVDFYYDSSPYRAYKSYIDTVCRFMDGGFQVGSAYYAGALLISAVTAAIYAAVHLAGNKGKKTVTVNTYVRGGEPRIRKRDDLIRKNVVKRKIETSSGGGGSGGSRSSGGGGHHVSGGGASHGGGGRRH